MDIQKAAAALMEAENEKKPIAPLTSSIEEISVDEAYQIQLLQIQNKVDNGAVIVGKKIGLTSKVMQEMFNVNEPDYGHILNDMVYHDGDTISLDRFIQPKIEFEIAFVLKKELKGPGVTLNDVIEATDYIVPALEIIDSRIRDWQINFEDTVVDNGSSAGAIIGKKTAKIDELDLAIIGMNVYKNNEFLDSGVGAAVMGHPAQAVAWLANALGNYGISLNAGEVILSGALSKAIVIEDGDSFTAEFEQLGAVSATFKNGR
ncbi:fumarylacetoacetate hydrolase family protein [Bacillus sp. sid0103]|uniref:2-keto-4-pentenoate hydratase n=1 Tax=Bacillus sp. sid0103 TaxID=2856337 RepID=UPI001C44C4E9|nr:fumarylacetoacetate hydrolase family protein [Bacillus sp. sid0103]MBV7503677.1 fumarylacetoacetate hydrolase family protein [Bacillus sp. sid0103]